MPKSDSRGSRTSAADALTPTFRAQVTDLRAWEAKLRLDLPDSVHGFRVAARRLRSTLVGFRPLFESEVVDQLRTELKTVAATVSGARDAEIVHRRVKALLVEELAGLDPDLDLEPALVGVRELIWQQLRSAYRQRWEATIEHLDGPEYDAFARRVESFADLPPWGPDARLSADEVLRPLLRREWSRFLSKGRKALDHKSGPAQYQRLHDARKAAKRARYVSEAVVPVFGKKAKRLGGAAERVQGVLGDHQDCVLTQQALAETGRHALLEGEVGSVLGRMHARESSTAEELRDDFVRLFGVAERRGLRRWLDYRQLE
jgi:CHAD domain-containing protein